MQTERYIITLFGIDTKYYTDEYISFLWENCANKEYKKSNHFITSLIDKRSLVCGRVRGCELVEYAHVITTVRNPAEIENTSGFFDSLKNILKELRPALGNPSMTITLQNIDYFYFI